MNMQLKIIELINAIDEIFTDELLLYDQNYENNIVLFDQFSYKLNEIFREGLNNELLEMILKLDSKKVFKIYGSDIYINNNIRKEIEKFIDKNEKLYLDFDLIINHITENQKLAKYVFDREKLLEFLKLNEKVISFIDSKYLTKTLVLNNMKKSNFTSLVFLGIHGNDSQLYKYSSFYKEDKEINELLYNQLKDILIKDYSLYIGASDLVKSNNKINDLIVSVDPRMSAYINKKDI